MLQKESDKGKADQVSNIPRMAFTMMTAAAAAVVNATEEDR